MAIDTAAKRHSALSWGQPWRTPPRPSGTIGQGPRQAAAFCYSGILAAGALTSTGTPNEFYESLPRGKVFSCGDLRGTVFQSLPRGTVFTRPNN